MNRSLLNKNQNMENEATPRRDLGATDKMGEPIYQDDIVFDNEDYYQIYYNEPCTR
jgi:hypothetical protein